VRALQAAEFDITVRPGHQSQGSVLDVAVELGFVKKAGAWFTYEGEQMAGSREREGLPSRETRRRWLRSMDGARAHGQPLLPDVVGTGVEMDIDTPISLD